MRIVLHWHRKWLEPAHIVYVYRGGHSRKYIVTPASRLRLSRVMNSAKVPRWATWNTDESSTTYEVRGRMNSG